MELCEIERLVSRLCDRDPKNGCASMALLLDESRRTDAVYPYLDRFAQMLESENSYLRTRGLLLIAANARWDRDFQIDELLDTLLAHIMDQKPIVSRQWIAALPELAHYKPDLAGRIRRALQKADPDRYPGSMAPLVQKDIAAALDQIEK